MSEQQLYDKINKFRNEHDDLSDGSFFALAEEQGIGVDEWAWFSEVEAEKSNPPI